MANLPPKDNVLEFKPQAVQSLGEKAAAWLESVARLVREKNKSYGDSAGDPIRIFSKAGPADGLTVRIDDKLSRIARGKEFPGDDTLRDLVGYIALYAAGQEPEKEQGLPDIGQKMDPGHFQFLPATCWLCSGSGHVYNLGLGLPCPCCNGTGTIK